MAKPPVAERPYETIFICPVDTPQKTVDTLIEKIKAIIEQEKGTFRSLQVWGRRRMTYPIKRQKDGIYIYIDFNSNNKVPELLKTLFHVSDFVLRHMTVLREDAPVIPAASTVTDASATEAVGAGTAGSVAAATPSVSDSKESPSTK